MAALRVVGPPGERPTEAACHGRHPRGIPILRQEHRPVAGAGPAGVSAAG
jgi:hypothetical protein